MPPKDPSANADKVAAIRAKLAAGRTMSALKDAKEHAKKTPGAASEDLLAAAYAARIGELAQTGKHKEAAEVLAVARARFPDRNELWQQSSSASATARGDLSELLLAWRDDAATRETLGATLRTTLRNPASIADSDVLAADDPLRIAAAAVRAAFVRVAAGDALEQAERDALRAVGRRSPLVPWRGFVLALDAFHRHDDERCRQALATIADTDSVANARDVLLSALLDRLPPADPRLARAVDVLAGETPKLAAIAREFTELLRNEDHDVWFEHAERTLQAFAAARRGIAARFFFGLAEQCHPADAIACAFGGDQTPERLFGESEGQRLVGLLEDEGGPAIATWCAWLTPKRTTLRALDDLELAIALRFLVDNLDALEQTLGTLAECDGMRFTHTVNQRILANRLIERSDEPSHAAAAAMFGLDFVLRALQQSRHRIDTGHDTVRASLLAHILALDPTAEAFGLYADALDSEPKADLRGALERWSAQHPRDLEPHLRLAERATDADDLDAALVHIQRASAIDSIDERVRSAHTRIHLLTLRRHWQGGDHAACRKAIQALEAAPGTKRREMRLLAAALRNLLGDIDRAALAAIVGGDHLVSAVLAASRRTFDDGPLIAESSNLTQRLQEVAMQARIASAIVRRYRDLPKSVLTPAMLPPPSAAGAGAAADPFPTDLEDLHGLGAIGSDTGALWLTAEAAHRGIQQDGPRLARFLYLRAFTLAGKHVRRARRCRELALFHARRLDDREIIAALTSGQRFVEAPDAAIAGTWLVEERALPPKTRAKSRRGQARHPQLPFPDAPTAESEA